MSARSILHYTSLNIPISGPQYKHDHWSLKPAIALLLYVDPTTYPERLEVEMARPYPEGNFGNDSRHEIYHAYRGNL